MLRARFASLLGDSDAARGRVALESLILTRCELVSPHCWVILMRREVAMGVEIPQRHKARSQRVIDAPQRHKARSQQVVEASKGYKARSVKS